MNIRVLHFPHNIGGNPVGLSHAEAKIGISSKAVEFQSSPFEAGARIGAVQRLILFGRYVGWFLYALIFTNAVHFNYGQKFLPFGIQPYKFGEFGGKRFTRYLGYWLSRILGEFDLRLLKLFRIKIVVTFQGDDIRMGDYCAKNYSTHFVHEVDAQYYDLVSDERKRKQVSIWKKYADQIFALNPDLLNLLPPSARFLPYAHVDLNDWRPVTVSNLRPLIVHAPTNRLVKGTRHIEAALNKLRSRGYDFDVEFVEGRTLSEAREIYSRADIVIDQVLAGWYGGFAVEAMALGKPVVAYIREADLRHIPKEMAQDLPVINATPESLESVLDDLLSGRVNLIAHGKASRKYVEKWHDPHRIAKITSDAYQGKK